MGVLYGIRVTKQQSQTISKLEAIQRNFTNRLHGLQELDYWERLHELKIYSLERRRDRYCILYVFKIVNDIVPNPGFTWSVNNRRGRLINIPLLAHKSRQGDLLKRKSFVL